MTYEEFLDMVPDHEIIMHNVLEDDGRWSAVCPLLPGCATYGNTLCEAYKNFDECIRLYLSDMTFTEAYALVYGYA